MFLDKINRRASGILLYGITPPKALTSPEKIVEIGKKSVNILSKLDIDALVVYDVQDETARTSEERPFPFSDAMDPLEYSSQHLKDLDLPKIIYRPAGKFSKTELSSWLDELRALESYPVFVGLPSPDYVPKTSLKEAYELWARHKDHSVIGAVMIPERHAVLKDEDVRILDKMNSGVSFFISQCIFNVDYTKKTLEDLIARCEQQKRSLPTIIFTLTICGSVKTLEFMEWLGIHMPDEIRDELCSCESPAVRSKDIAVGIANDLINYCEMKSIPFGFNIESVATRKEEVEASLQVLETITELLKIKGLRATAKAFPVV